MTGFRVADGGPVIPNFGRGSDCLRNNDWFCTELAARALGRHPAARADPAHRADADRVVGIGLAVAFLLALAGFRWRFLDPLLGAGTDVLYTLPSIALFTVLVSITGLEVITIAIPLIAYTLFILYRNIVAGLRSVPAEVLESARGMGLTRRQTFMQVEFPLATPAIMAGVRIATVSTISIATLGAFFINYGLGTPIFDALGVADIFRTELVAASGLAILLALVADVLLSRLQRVLTPWSRVR